MFLGDPLRQSVFRFYLGVVQQGFLDRTLPGMVRLLNLMSTFFCYGTCSPGFITSPKLAFFTRQTDLLNFLSGGVTLEDFTKLCLLAPANGLFHLGWVSPRVFWS